MSITDNAENMLSLSCQVVENNEELTKKVAGIKQKLKTFEQMKEAFDAVGLL